MAPPVRVVLGAGGSRKRRAANPPPAGFQNTKPWGPLPGLPSHASSEHGSLGSDSGANIVTQRAKVPLHLVSAIPVPSSVLPGKAAEGGPSALAHTPTRESQVKFLAPGLHLAQPQLVAATGGKSAEKTSLSPFFFALPSQNSAFQINRSVN